MSDSIFKEAKYYMDLSRKDVTTMAQMAVLKCLIICERYHPTQNGLDAKELAKNMVCQRSRVTSLCRMLKKRGLIVGEKCYLPQFNQHQREMYLLTDRGRDIAETEVPV